MFYCIHNNILCQLGYSLHTAMLFVSVLDVFVVLTWMYLFVKRCRNWKRNQRIFLSNWMMNSIENNYSLKSFWNDGFYVDFCFVFIIKNILLLVFRCYHSYCRLSKTYIYSKLEDSNREHTKIYCLGGSGWCSNMHVYFMLLSWGSKAYLLVIYLCKLTNLNFPLKSGTPSPLFPLLPDQDLYMTIFHSKIMCITFCGPILSQF